MLKRVFVFLLSFFFFIGGTLATAQAASVEAVDDSSISLTSFVYDDVYSDSFRTLTFYDDSGNVISSLSNVSYNVLTTMPSGTHRINFYIVLSDVSDFSGDYVTTFSFSSLPSLSAVNCNFLFYDSNLVQIDYSVGTLINSYVASGKSFSFSFNSYCSSVYSILISLYFDGSIGSSVSFYTPNISITSYDSFSLEETNNLLSTGNDLVSTGNGLLSNIWSSITALPQQIINLFITAMQSLFIPSDDYFTTKFNELYVLFDDKLGFLMYPTEVFSSFVSALQTSSNGFVIDFPAFSIDVGGSSYQVWDDYTFNFDDIKNNFPEIFSAAEIIFTVILCGYSINLIITYYDVVVWGSSSTALVEQGGRDDY